jgi:hypothetical protein
LKPESKFWQEVKKNLKDISFTRLESWASSGVPDLLCYNKNGVFFTVELKVAIREHVRLSPQKNTPGIVLSPRSLLRETLSRVHGP